ncbi:hypothetical protein [uncultured Sulfitobacter sp.]|uniref:hypothetical protein n=1 Tax=uncultured Sulfitobacter sp. TaxID=191468 RepID=UPI002614BCA9|nr:hypothetical protein [uncultured Sulfitobacter sp.]
MSRLPDINKTHSEMSVASAGLDVSYYRSLNSFNEHPVVVRYETACAAFRASLPK